MYNERSQKWKHNLVPPTPTARHSVGMLSLQSVLVVAGGDRTISTCIAAVEIFKVDTSQWYRTDLLPTACCNVSLVVICNTYYALGGYKDSYLNQALYASVDDLLHILLHQPTRSPTVVAVTLNQLGRHYPTLQTMDQLQLCYLANF